jgi:lipopolysaccharide export system protein LptC
MARPPRPPGAAARVPWHWQLRESLVAALPLLLMVLLALASWWLVKNAPKPLLQREAKAPRHEPDYTMQGFTVQRFGPDGRLRVRIEGDQARHYPDTDILEIDQVRIRAWGEDGSVTVATARRALANGDGSEVQLLGGARVESSNAQGGEPVRFEGEFLHAFLRTERLRSHLPVRVTQGNSEMQGGGLDYDHLSRVMQLQGPVRARFIPGQR